MSNRLKNRPEHKCLLCMLFCALPLIVLTWQVTAFAEGIPEPVYYSGINTDTHLSMTVFGRLTINGVAPVVEGIEIGIYDLDGVLCGASGVTIIDGFFRMQVYGDDQTPSDTGDEGLLAGQELSFEVYVPDFNGEGRPGFAQQAEMTFANSNFGDQYNSPSFPPVFTDMQTYALDLSSTVLPDGDMDGIPDTTDAFPNDPSASVDSDGDGYPDSWNEGCTQEDSTTGLTLDDFPNDPNEHLATTLNDTTTFVQQVYLDFLNRAPDAGGLAYWVDAIDNQGVPRAQLVEGFLNSAEFGETVAPVTRLYFAYFNRLPDYSGLMYWIGSYAQGTPLETISDAFAGSAEFIATYGTLDNSAFVTLVYQNVLGRDPDAGGLSYWTGVLDRSEQTRGQVMIGFSESAEYIALMENQIYVTMTYIGLLRRSPDQGGFDYWVGVMDAGGSGLSLIEGFLNSAEYAARFEDPPEASSMAIAMSMADATIEVTALQFAYPYNLLQEQTQVDQTADGQYDNLETIDTTYDSQGRYSGHQIQTDHNRDGDPDAITTISLSYNSAGNPDIHLKQQDDNNDGQIDQTSRQRYLYNSSDQLIGHIEEQQGPEGQYQTQQTIAHTLNNNQLQSTTIIHDINQDGEIDQTQIHYSYDSDGLLSSETTEIDLSQNGLDQSTVTHYLYTQGQISEQTTSYDTNADTQINQYDSTTYSYNNNQLTQIETTQETDGTITATKTVTISYNGSDPIELISETDSNNDGSIDQRTQILPSFNATGYQSIQLPVSPARPVPVPIDVLLLNR